MSAEKLLVSVALLVTLLFASLSLAAQVIPQEEPVTTLDELKKPRPAWMDKLHYGGNVGLGFFGAFFVNVSPMIGYEITKAGTTAGLGGMFLYQGTFGQNNSQFAVGPSLFIRQPVWRSIFLHAEYEFINATENNFYSYNPPSNPAANAELKRVWGGSPLIGAGFYQGRNRQQGGSFISVMYNLGYPTFGYINPQGLGGRNSPLLLRVGFFF